MILPVINFVLQFMYKRSWLVKRDKKVLIFFYLFLVSCYMYIMGESNKGNS